MNIRQMLRQKTKPRDAPKKRSVLSVGSMAGWEEILCAGYKPLHSCPEVQTAIGVYADLIASMTIQLMQNTDKGDVRIRNALSRKLDIEPHRNMTHQTFMSNLVRVMLTYGNQVTLPRYSRDGYLEDLEPLPPGEVSFVKDGDSYRIIWRGRSYAPDEVLHFPVNPDPQMPWKGRGYDVALKDVVDSLRQATATKNALMKSPAPNVIVKVDGLMEDLQSKEGRETLRQQYLEDSETGKPWMIPAEALEITQVTPLNLNDLAIDKNLELDKRSAAAIVGVPPFLVGVGTFNETEFDWFVATRVMAIARIIEQELTRKLLISPDLYFRLNNRSLLNYNLEKVSNVCVQMVDRITMRRNEWRDWMGLPPDEDMDELLALENYIPATMLGQQKKLEPTGGESDAETSGKTA